MTTQVSFNFPWGSYLPGDVVGIPDALAAQLAATPAPIFNGPPFDGNPRGFIVTSHGTVAAAAAPGTHQTADTLFAELGSQHLFAATLQPS